MKKINTATPVTPQQINAELLMLSVPKGLWNGLRIGAVYSVLLAVIYMLPGLLDNFTNVFNPYFFQSLQHILQFLIPGIIAGGVIGMCIGIFLGLLCGTATTMVSYLRFYPIQSWLGYRVWLGIFHILLVIGAFVAFAMIIPGIREIFTIYEPGRYRRHTFSRPDYILITFGFGYGTLLLACIYSWFHAGTLAHRYAQIVGISRQNTLFGPDTDLYDRLFQERAFGALAKGYSHTSRVVSLGRDNTLRARLVEHMHLAPGMAVCDLMAGDGAMWPHLVPLIGPDGAITAVDFAPEMLTRAQERLHRLPARPVITLHQSDARATGLPNDHFDAVVCAFGLATLTPTQFDDLLQEILRILRPGGIFGFVELSRPAGTQRQRWFDAYLTDVAPSLSKLLGTNPGAPLLLHEYLTRFDNGQLLLQSFYRHQCIFYHYEFFGGYATAIVGMKDSA